VNHFNELQVIEAKVHRTLQAYQMLTKAKRVIVACSGGADSMMLLHFLMQMHVPVVAAHVHHGLRGKEADRDEKMVQEFCTKHKIQFKTLHIDVEKRAKQLGIGFEECGRQVRYAFFRDLADSQGDKIATAHTLSDVCETVLLHISRGTGLRGLCGIPPVRDNIIRPLLGITRQEVEEYCACCRLSYVIDSTNFEKKYHRNHLRLDVIPLLKQLNPSFEEAVLRMTQQCREDSNYLDEQTQQYLLHAKTDKGYRTSVFVQMPKAIRSRAILLTIKQTSMITPTYKQVEQIDKAILSYRGAVTLTGGVQFRVEGDYLFIQTIKMDKVEWEVTANAPMVVLNDGRIIQFRHQIVNNYENHKNFQKILFHNSVDYGTITDNATFRNRRKGDMFRPAGRGITKSLKKLFNEAKIPPSKRDDIVILANGEQILWIEGFGVSEYGCVTSHTTKLVSISIKEAELNMPSKT